MNIRPEDYQASNSSSRPPLPRQISENGDLMVRVESNRSLNILSNDEHDVLPDLKSLTVQPTNKGAGISLTTAYNHPEKKKQTTLDDDNDFLKKILADEPDDNDNEKVPSSQPQPDDDDLVDSKSMLPFFPPLADINTFQTPVSSSSLQNNKRRKYNPYDLEPSTPEIDTEQRMMSFDMRYRILSNIDILSAPSCMDDSIQSPRRDIESPRKIPVLTRKPNFNVALHKMMHSRNPSLLKLRREREYNQ